MPLWHSDCSTSMQHVIENTRCPTVGVLWFASRAYDHCKFCGVLLQVDEYSEMARAADAQCASEMSDVWRSAFPLTMRALFAQR